MLQYKLLRYSPSLLRWYRLQITLDWMYLIQFIPQHGELLDVGCGVGTLSYILARTYPDLRITGIDTNIESIQMAQKYHAHPNINYACTDLRSMQNKFDCVFFCDVFHHINIQAHREIIRECTRILRKGGYIFIKDIERKNGIASILMDRYISGCTDLFLRDCPDMADEVGKFFDIQIAQVRFKFPFPHYYIKAHNHQR